MDNIKVDISLTESNDDWIRSARLVSNGSKKSLEELDRMDNTGMVTLDEELEEELDFEEEIINYQIYDVSGMIGEFATTSELTNLRDYIDDLEDNENTKEFINKGASLLTEEFVSEINKLKSEDNEIQSTIEILQYLVDKADTVVIINDGLKEER